MFLFISILLAGCVKEEGLTRIPPEISSQSENPKYAFSSYYSHEGIEIKGGGISYTLPLKENDIKNFDFVNEELNLTQNAVELLKKNGFVVVNYGKEDDLSIIYQEMKAKGIPIFVTTDTVLHLYHIHFNEILKNIEERDFFDSLVKMSRALYEQSLMDYSSYEDEKLKEAGRRNVAYFAVALKLLGEDVEVPHYAEKMVNEEMMKIEKHEGFGMNSIFHYEEDYSQYVPRGHYTQSEKLQRYFKTMMWYGRMAFLLKGGENCIVSEEDAHIATLQAAIISWNLYSLKMDGINISEIWERIYAITSFFVGTADDLTPYEYIENILDLFGKNFTLMLLANDNNFASLQNKLLRLRGPAIYGGVGNFAISPPFTKEKMEELLNKTKGMHFMGQRYVPDSYIFQQLISPAVGMYNGNVSEENKPFTLEYTMGGWARCFPRGLDVMAVLGSERALEILEKEGDIDYSGENTSYMKQMKMLRDEFEKMNVSEWNRNLYWSWLYSLKILLEDVENIYPPFMHTQAWRDKALNTALASWSELRHDTILYAKQSYTPRLTSIPLPTEGYVEPLPEFYLRLKALVNMTMNGLQNLNAINESEMERLLSLQNIIEKLFHISIKELEGKALNEEDGNFLTNFVDDLNTTLSGLNKDAKTTVMVADVHTDANTMKCLEEGVGYLNLIIVAYSTPHGIYVGGGPVMSYYEFKQPVEKRLTDDGWRDMLQKSPPSLPSWTSSFIA